MEKKGRYFMELWHFLFNRFNTFHLFKPHRPTVSIWPVCVSVCLCVWGQFWALWLVDPVHEGLEFCPVIGRQSHKSPNLAEMSQIEILKPSGNVTLLFMQWTFPLGFWHLSCYFPARFESFCRCHSHKPSRKVMPLKNTLASRDSV